MKSDCHRYLSPQLQAQTLTSSLQIKKKKKHFFPMHAHVDQNGPISWEKEAKNRPVCKNAVTQAYM